MDKLSVADVLERAADLIEPEGAWTQGAFSRNDAGYADADEDETTAVNPVCWCALGAVAHVAGADTMRFDTFSPLSLEPQAKARLALQTQLGQPVEDWNDAPERTQAEVVAMLRKAAALAKASPTTEGEG